MKKHNKKRRSWIIPACIAGMLGICAFHWMAGTKPKPTVVRQSDLETIIRRNTVVEKVIPGNSGRVYLIAQEHYYAGMTREGRDPNAKQQESLPYIQSEIYHLLYDLCNETGLSLVVGEGLGPKELILPYGNKGLSRSSWENHRERMKDYNFSVNFLKANPKEPSYAVLELFHPDLVFTCGVDDSCHLAEIERIDKERFALALKYIPTKQDHDNPEKLRLFREAEKPLLMRKDALNDERSLLYLSGAIKRADEMQKQDVAIIIGSAHISLMVQHYKDKRTLYILKPKSVKPWK
jgi:hypothetical protein